MPFGNDPWSDRIAQVNDDGPRRALLAEIGLWRASRLTDIQAARQATYAMSRLHWLLREREAAEREARQLLSLCQTPPRASDEDLQAATAWLQSMGAKAPKVPRAPAARERQRGSRRERKRPAEAPASTSAPGGPTRVEQAIHAADAGDLAGALKLLKGKRGGRADLVRVWIHLRHALSRREPEALRSEVEQLAGRIRGQLGPDALDALTPAEAAPTSSSEALPEAGRSAASDEGPSAPSPRALARQRADALRAALTAAEPPAPGDLVPLLSEWPRLWRAIAAAERWDLDEGRLIALLRAVDAAADDDRTIPGGTSLLVRMASTGSAAARELLSTDPTRARYGGPGLDAVVDIAAAAAGGGWEVDRVLRGPTRKERERHALLAEVGDAMDGLLRILVRRGDARAEVWVLGDLPPEGRAGVPPLLAEDRPRVVVVPVDPEVLGWYRDLGGPEPIGWTGSEADAVRAALDALA